MFSIYINDKTKFDNFLKIVLTHPNSSKKITKNDKIHALIKFQDLTITFYNSQRIQFNKEIPQILEDEFLKLIDKTLYVGVDEVGIGEPIGPIVVCGVKFKKFEDKLKLIKLGIRDSKKISFKKLELLNDQIKKCAEIKIIILEPKRLNELLDKKMNLKKINALMHNKIHNSFTETSKKPLIHISDGFASRTKYFEYLSDLESNYPNFKLIEKADDYFAEVAAASIVAKHSFNNWIINFFKENKIENNFNKKINPIKLQKQLLASNLSKEKLYQIKKKWKKGKL